MMSPDEFVDAAKKSGLDGVCLTEHDRFWDAGAVAELSKRHGILVLPGCEVTTEEGHLLVFGLSEYVFGMHSAAFVKRLVDEDGGTMLLAHPYRRMMLDDAFEEAIKRGLRSAVLRLVDGVEGLNGRGSERENEYAYQLGEMMSLRMPLGMSGGSDAHSLDDVGVCATEFERDIASLDDLIRELRAGRFRPVRLRGEVQ